MTPESIRIIVAELIKQSAKRHNVSPEWAKYYRFQLASTMPQIVQDYGPQGTAAVYRAIASERDYRWNDREMASSTSAACYIATALLSLHGQDA